MKFYPSPSGNITRVVEVKKAYYLEDYVNTKQDEHYKYDFAILELAEDLSDHGYFGVDSSENNYEPAKKQKLILAGYPKKEQKIIDSNDPKTWDVSMQWDHNKDQEIETIMDEEEFIKYKIEAAKANSGSPVFKEENGEVYMVGIHIGGSKTKQYNQAVRLTDRVRSIINSWVGKKGKLFLGKSLLMKVAKNLKMET